MENILILKFYLWHAKSIQLITFYHHHHHIAPLDCSIKLPKCMQFILCYERTVTKSITSIRNGYLYMYPKCLVILFLSMYCNRSLEVLNHTLFCWWYRFISWIAYCLSKSFKVYVPSYRFFFFFRQQQQLCNFFYLEIVPFQQPSMWNHLKHYVLQIFAWTDTYCEYYISR